MKGKLHEIKCRYSRNARRGGNVVMRMRRRDLETVFRARYGDALPDNKIGREALFLLTHTVRAAGALAIMTQARHWAPWMTGQVYLASVAQQCAVRLCLNGPPIRVIGALINCLEDGAYPAHQHLGSTGGSNAYNPANLVRGRYHIVCDHNDRRRGVYR